MDINGLSILIGCIYRSTNQMIFDVIDNDNRLFQLISSLDSSKMFLLMGDFNAPNVNWGNYSAYGGDDTFDVRLVNALLDNFITQHVTDPTRRSSNWLSSSVLDLVLTRNIDCESLSQITHLPPLGNGDHNVLLFTVDIPEVPDTSIHRNILDFRKADVGGISSSFTNFYNESWDTIKARNDVQILNDSFLSVNTDLVSKYVPILKLTSQKSLRHPWVTKTCIRAIKRKHDAWCRPVNVNVTAPSVQEIAIKKLLYTRTKNYTNRVIKTQRMTYEKKLAKLAKKTPKRIYDYVKKVSGIFPCSNNVNMLISKRGVRLRDSLSISNEFADFFDTVFLKNDTVIDFSLSDDQHVVGDQIISDIDFSLSDVLDELHCLDPCKAAGPDNVSASILKKCRGAIAPILYDIFRTSLNQGIVPDQWKEAVVCPVYKGAKAGSRLSANSYRPVSLTSQCGKVLERIIKRELVNFFESTNVISSAQHGFRSNRSCVTNLIEMLDTVTAALDENAIVDIAFLDFSKAFDKVSHPLLIRKLYGYGVRGRLLKWICSFLNGRSQQVKVSNSLSRKVTVSSGVPQGSVLGPLLFIVFINDLPDVLPCIAKLFADDTKLANIIRNDMDVDNLQMALDNLYRWSIENKLPFNPEKCQVLSFSKQISQNLRVPYRLGDSIIKFAFQENDLGVLLTTNLDSGAHVSKIIIKANAVLGVLKRTFLHADDELLLLLYKSLVRPLLEYAVQVWCPSKQKDIKRIEAVQRRATRLLRGCRGLEYEDRLRYAGITSLDMRRQRGDQILMYRIMTNKIDIDKNSLFQIPQGAITRGHPLRVGVRRSNCNARNSFFSHRCVNKWNSLPGRVVEASTVNNFKNLYDTSQARYVMDEESSVWTT